MWIILARHKRTKTWKHADTFEHRTEKSAVEQAQEYIEDEGGKLCIDEFGVVEILDSKVKIVKMKDRR